MESSLVVTIVTAVGGLLAKLGVDSRPARLRKDINGTVDLIAKAKDAGALGPLKADLDAVLSSQAARLRAFEKATSERQWDFGGFAVGLFLTIATGVGAWMLYRLNAWYWTGLAVVLALLAAILLLASFGALKKRAERSAT